MAGVVFAAGLLAAYFLAQKVDGSAESKVHDSRNGVPRLMAVDESGAVVQNQDQTWGVTRGERSPSWVMKSDQASPLHAACVGGCPRAVLSGDLNSLASPLAPDPDPLEREAKVPLGLEAKSMGKLLLFGLGPDYGLRYATDEQGIAQWSTLLDGKLTRTPAGVGYVDWFPASDQTAAIASIDGAQGRVQQLWVNENGWRPVGRTARTRTGFGCTASRGAYRMTSRAAIQPRTGTSIPLANAPAWSNCAFTRDRLVVAGYRFENGREVTTLGLYRLDGALIRRWEIAGEHFLYADAGGRTFALVSGREATVMDASGRPIKRLSGVCDARYDSTGELVTVDTANEVAWISTR